MPDARNRRLQRLGVSMLRRTRIRHGSELRPGGLVRGVEDVFQLRVLQEQSLVEQGDGNAVLLESWDGGLHDLHFDADA